MVYVNEQGNSRVSVFTSASAGIFMTSFGSNGEQPGQFGFPCGVAVNELGIV